MKLQPERDKKKPHHFLLEIQKALSFFFFKYKLSITSVKSEEKPSGYLSYGGISPARNMNVCP